MTNKLSGYAFNDVHFHILVTIIYVAKHGTQVVIPYRDEDGKRFLKLTGDLGQIVSLVRNVQHVESSFWQALIDIPLTDKRSLTQEMNKILLKQSDTLTLCIISSEELTKQSNLLLSNHAREKNKIKQIKQIKQNKPPDTSADII